VSSSCAEALSLLPARPLEALEADEEAFVAEHLAACASCRARSEATFEAFAALRGPKAEAAPGRPDPLWEKIRSELDRPPEAVEPAKGVQVTIALVCCFCHDGVARTEATYCASCLAPHHAECFRAHGRCSAFGCDETRTVRPGIEPPRRRRLVRFGLGVLLAGGLAGAAALTTYEVSERRHQAELARMEAEYHAQLEQVVRRIMAEQAAKEGEKEDAARRTPIGASETSLEKQIDEIFARIESLIRDRKIDELPPMFQELDTQMRAFGTAGTDEAQKALKRWSKKLDEWKEVRLAIQLQIYISQGNDLLRALVRAKESHDYDLGHAAFQRVLALVGTMRGEEREEFHRNAEAIEVRAKALIHELAASSIELAMTFVGGPPANRAVELPEGTDWSVTRIGNALVLVVRGTGTVSAHVTVPVEAAEDLLGSLEERIAAHEADGEPAAMETGLYTGTYESETGGERFLVPHLTYQVLDHYTGVDDEGKQHVDRRITLVVQDTKKSFWPFIVKMNLACAKDLGKQIEAALK
jgi:hypothetical protein